jgi:lipid-A-disaccharide synthase
MSPALHLRATLATTAATLGALFSFVPFVPRLVRAMFTGRSDRERILGLMRAGLATQPSDPPGDLPSGVRVLLVAGEPSGDLHGADLAVALRRIDPEVRLEGIGGPRMAAAGVDVLEDLVSDPVMGVIPVLKKLPYFFGLYRRILIRMETDPPDVMVGIDYPGLNLRLATAARARGIPFVDYIAPQVWAWAPWRTEAMARSVSQIVSILPFEAPIFEEAGAPVAYVGHPLFENLARRGTDAAFRADLRADVPEGGALVALMPGSRRAEVEANLPMQMAAAKLVLVHSPDTRFVVPLARERLRPMIEAAIAKGPGGVRIAAPEHSDDAMAEADAAITVSGTATLHLVAHDTPAVVMYRVSRSRRVLASMLLVSPYIALPNLLSGREVLPEFLAADGDEQRIANAVLGIMPGGPSRDAVTAALADIRARLHEDGVAEHAAKWVLSTAADA